MTSVLNVDEIAAKDGTSPVALTKQSAAKHWVQYNQDTPATVASFNTSSVTDDSAGKYTPALTSSMDSATYGLSLTTRIENSNNGYLTGPGTMTASNYQGQVWRIGSVAAFTDSYFNSTAIHGDLA